MTPIWPVSKRVNVSGRGDDDPSLVEPVEDGAVYEGSPLGPNELFPQDHPDTIASIPRQGHLGSVQLAQSASSFGAISSHSVLRNIPLVPNSLRRPTLGDSCGYGARACFPRLSPLNQRCGGPEFFGTGHAQEVASHCSKKPLAQRV
jgi:hypothetical protein